MEREFYILKPKLWDTLTRVIGKTPNQPKAIEQITAQAEPLNQSELTAHPANESIVYDNKVYVRGDDSGKVK